MQITIEISEELGKQLQEKVYDSSPTSINKP